MVDTSSGMLEVLGNKIEEMELANVTSRLLDLTRESYDGHFDLIFSAMTLHHIEETELILKNLCQLLNDNGYLAIADLDSEDGTFHSAGAGEKHHGFNRESLAEILENLGLSSIRFKTVHTVTRRSEDLKVRTYPVFLLTAQKLHVF
jgi:2-polyprenyl-3-methyl-5-hydroxy-6-metoxy-1,4-benzoquinol methylase